MAPPTRFERVAFRLGGERSILLSYGGVYGRAARETIFLANIYFIC